jgi:HEAT repeat protein
MEPVWGGREDTAGELRAVCAIGLVQAKHPRALDELVVLLLDPLRVARVGAARAIGDSGQRAGVPLLRYKILAGDGEPEVLTECFSSLLHLEPEASFDFVRGHLFGDDGDRAEAAALALGQSRMPRAAPVLIAWAADRLVEDRRVAYVSLALLRTPEAFEHLLGVVERGEAVDAENALDALAVHAHDLALRERVGAVVDHRGDRPIAERFASAWSRPATAP